MTIIAATGRFGFRRAERTSALVCRGACSSDHVNLYPVLDACGQTRE
ncbi:hypothetical protein [Gracilibacillus alcaliphilus]|nr:hypothetical protein [Gracilibacillus alcaliphilus]MBM7676280.1 hypothetical protein [Gracilibacillus alcaliphilus]